MGYLRACLAFGTIDTLGCLVYGATSIISGLSSIWVLSAITYERYKVIASGFSGQNKFSMNTILTILALIWGFSTLLAIFPFLGWNAYVYEGFFTTCTMNSIAQDVWDRSYTYFLLVVAYLIPMCIITYSNMSIVYNNKTNNKEIFELMNMRKRSFQTSNTSESVSTIANNSNVEQGSTPLVPGMSSNVHVNKFKQDRHMIEIRLAKVAFFLILLWLVAWTPYALVFFWSLTPYSQYLHPIYDVFPGVFCKMSAAINPYIYGLCLPKFRREIYRIFFRAFFCRSRSPNRGCVN
ncbi:hypothetical protein TCAL_16172 [Tigriopus californicus]|uniref:G-protein coupled receptors family 1 profile domain-containing protein n=1 Tax=Tigriopus californicus TaxID=6832 RepID=A0A553P3K9_TIGCA|nr:hypothetical protein TCAL_16172 [Tigriopus californicus]